MVRGYDNVLLSNYMEVCCIKKKLNIRMVYAIALILMLATICSFTGVRISAKAEEVQKDEKELIEILDSNSKNMQELETEIDESEANIDASTDAYYILSHRTYSNTPKSEFKRKPRYGLYNFDSIRVGDIIYESKVLDGIGHCAIVSDVSHDSYYGTYIQTIEAVGGGVQYGYLDDYRMYDYGVYVCTPYLVNDVNRGKAVDFCKNQLGKAWWYDTDDTPIDLDENQQSWYCSELIFAAYYNATGSLLQTGVTDSGHVLPGHLYYTWQTADVVKYDELFLRLSIDTSKPKWTINVYNPNHNDVYVCYNTKMCFGNDAINWTNNLKNPGYFTLSACSTLSKNVSTNLFATHVTFSWVYSTGTASVRFVTYVYELSTTGTLSVGYNIIYL